MLMNNFEIREKLIELNNEELNVLRELVECYDDVEKRKKLSWRYDEINREIGDIIYLDEAALIAYDSIPEIAASLEEMASLEHERIILERQEAESKCPQPKPEPREEVVETFDVDGDIVITDPCYIDEFINPSHSRSTLYGDWGCSVWSFDPTVENMPKEGEKPFGEFCADSAKVCVTVLGSYARKKIENWLKGREWCATIIDGFKGKVEYIELVEYIAYNGDWVEDRSLRIRGTGVKDGKPYGFITSQTSL